MEDATPAECPELTDDAAKALMDTWYNEIWTGDFDALETITTPEVYHHWAVGPDTSGQPDQLARLQSTVNALAGLTSPTARAKPRSRASPAMWRMRSGPAPVPRAAGDTPSLDE